MQDHSVFITGATSDIGQAICLRFGQAGYHVFAHARDDAKGKALIATLEESGIASELLVADLLDADAPEYLINHIKESKRNLRAVVNNAGGVLERGYRRGIAQDPKDTYQVNVFAAHAISVLGAVLMSEGAIVNVSSIQAHSARGPEVPHYGSSKAALSHLTKLLAVQLAPSVRVNAVSPGRTRTSAWGEISSEQYAAMGNDLLIERWIEPDEIADAVYFLAHNKACVGTDLIIDGGISLRPAG